MRNRLVYIVFLVLSLPAIHWGYFIISSPYKYSDTGPEDYIGAALGLVLALFALYGLITGRSFSTLPKIVFWLAIAAAAVASFFVAMYALLIMLAINWN